MKNGYLKEMGEHIYYAGFFSVLPTVGAIHVANMNDGNAALFFSTFYGLAILNSIGEIRSYTDYGKDVYAPFMDDIARDIWRSA